MIYHEQRFSTRLARNIHRLVIYQINALRQVIDDIRKISSVPRIPNTTNLEMIKKIPNELGLRANAGIANSG